MYDIFIADVPEWAASENSPRDCLNRELNEPQGERFCGTRDFCYRTGEPSHGTLRLTTAQYIIMPVYASSFCVKFAFYANISQLQF